MSPAERERKPTGLCRVCRKRWRVTGDGRLYRHGAVDGNGHQVWPLRSCDGSGRPMLPEPGADTNGRR